MKTCIKESLFRFIALWTIFINKWASVKNMYGFLRCEPGPQVQTPANCSLCTPEITFSDIFCCIFQAHIFILNQQIWFSCGLVITSQFTEWDLEITVLKSSINFARNIFRFWDFLFSSFAIFHCSVDEHVCLLELWMLPSQWSYPVYSFSLSTALLQQSEPRLYRHAVSDWAFNPWREGEKIITGVKDRDF